MIYSFGITQAISDSASTNFINAILMGLYVDNPTTAFSGSIAVVI